MRILGFGKKWPKLKQCEFTTFRFPRRDKDWGVGEQVQIVFRPRSKEREILGTAVIIDKQERGFDHIVPEDCAARSELEAREDGFQDRQEMVDWLWDTYKSRVFDEHINKLTLRWSTNTTDC